MNGISIWRKSLLDGHTALSSSESISKGNVKFVAGVLLVFYRSRHRCLSGESWSRLLIHIHFQ